MITEDYCSLEVSKLLKKKGFDEICEYEYGIPNVDNGYVLQRFFKPIKNPELIDDAYAVPTLQRAMKWLREVHNIHINLDVHWLYFANALGWMYAITKILENGVDYICSNGDENDKTFYSTYEEACEAAIKYCLKNLI